MLENGFNGIPRACRSARVRGPIGKKSEGGQDHSFEILASVAGKLLDKGDKFLNSHSCCAKEQYCTCDDTILVKKFDEDLLELGNCDEKNVSCDAAYENFYSKINTTSRHFKGSGMIDPDEPSETSDGKKERYKSPHFLEVIEGKVWSKRRIIKDEIDEIMGVSGDQKTLEDKPPGLTGHFTCHLSNVKEVSEDVIENSLKALPGTENQDVKKISETMNHVIASVSMDENHCSDDGKTLELYDDKASCYTQERSQKIYPFKKRKFFNHEPLSKSDRGFDREGVLIPRDKRIKACTESQRVNPNSKDCNVKLSIKSFKVPELFIDISTNATVGSLKRTVMEAVTSILGDGLHVGILVHGKKVRDDNKTLVQTGISQDDKCHNLGFFLEPKQSRTTTTTYTRSKNESLMSRSRSHGLTRHCASLTSTRGTSNVSQHRPVESLGGCIESDSNEGHAFVGTSSNKANQNCKSMVAMPSRSVEALAVVPLPRKSGHHEYVQRRIRRPFSVSEVEALVRAVEKLGTGRWRDVKFHAFDNAKHRTYVDLKDKWKTLVHTARISPQQRRGEPVPQELLDRVLAAQAHWSHRQAKQHARIAL